MYRLLSCCLIGVAACSQSLAQDYRYAVFEIPWLGDDFSSAQAINAQGTATVFSRTGPVTASLMRWTNDVEVEHARLSYAQGNGINDPGDVVGEVASHGMLWQLDGQIINLGALGGELSSAYGINSFGQITGYADLPENNPDGGHAFLWENGQMRDLGTPGRGSAARAINNRTQIVGRFTPISSNTTTPFFWENDQFTVLPNLSGSRPAEALDINDDSVVIGWAGVPFPDEEHAVKWINGEIFDINDASTTNTSLAQCINNRGDIGGNMYSRSEQRTVGFLLEAGTTRMLNLNLYLPPHRKYDVTWVNDVNDFGQIAGRDVARDHGVILSPVTPTLLLNDPTPGSAGMSNRLVLTGATPGERIYFVYGLIGGGTAIPGCDLQTGAAAQIDDPVIIGTAVADQQGRASVTRFVPNSAAGRDILIQAIQKDGCKVSQLVVHRFE